MSKIHLLLAALLGFMFLGQINSSPSDENTPLVFLNDTNGNSIDSFAMDEFGNIEFNLKKPGIYYLNAQSRGIPQHKRLLLTAGKHRLKIEKSISNSNQSRLYDMMETEAIAVRSTMSLRSDAEIPKSISPTMPDDLIIKSIAPTRSKEKDARAGVMTAGTWSDLENWEKYKETYHSSATIRGNWVVDLDRKRYSVEIQLAANNGMKRITKAASGLPVRILNYKNQVVWQTTTDSRGYAELWNSPFLSDEKSKSPKCVLQYSDFENPSEWKTLGKIEAETGRDVFTISVKDIHYNQNVDIAFIVDATGSMGDEINYLKKELMNVILNAQRLLPCSDIRLGTVFYKDIGDEYLTRYSPFTNRIEDAVGFIQDQYAGGGGDYPEAVDAGLSDGLNKLRWSDYAHSKIAFLILDAPPHEQKKIEINRLSKEYAKKGIRIIPIAASGINKPTEFLLKQLAVLTGGEYIYITDDSGVGNSHIKPSGVKSNVDLLKNHLERVIVKYGESGPCDKTYEPNNSEPRTVVFGDQKVIVQSFPNPASTHIDIHSNIAIKAIKIITLDGKLIKEESQINQDRYRVSVDDIMQGLYVLKVETAQRVYSSKVLILNQQRLD